MRSSPLPRPWAEPLQIGGLTLANRLALAPMSGVSTAAARWIAAEAGAGLVMTETISARALLRGSSAAEAKLAAAGHEGPLAVQLFGSEADALREASRRLSDQGVAWIDLNVGCPVKKFIRQGAGAALLRDPVGLARILGAMRRRVSGVLSLKIRLGWDASHRNAPEIARLAREEGVELISVHGRTRTQQYRGRSDPHGIRDVVEAVPELPVLANGDVTEAAHVPALMQATGAAGVMIGRGAIANPWIFERALHMNASEIDRDALEIDPSRRLVTLEKHIELVARSTDAPEDRARELRRYAVAYSRGLPGGKRFRAATADLDDPMELVDRARRFLRDASCRRAA